MLRTFFTHKIISGLFKLLKIKFKIQNRVNAEEETKTWTVKNKNLIQTWRHCPPRLHSQVFFQIFPHL